MNLRRILAAALLLGATVSSANTLDLIGGSPRATAMGGAQTAESNDPAATFYNPAMLGKQNTVNTLLAVTYTATLASVERTDLDSSKELDCTYCTPKPSLGFIIGLTAPLQGKLKDRVTIGLTVHLPSDVVLRTKVATPDRPFWYLYDNNLNRLVLFLGAGIKIIDEVYLGVGTQILADLVGQGAQMEVDLFSKDVRFREINSHLAPHPAPTAGLSFFPTRGLRAGISWRNEMSNFYSIPAEVNLGGVGTLAFVLSGYNHYTPHQFNAGVGYDISDQTTVSADISYELWSAAPTPFVDLVIDLSGETLEALGLGDALDITAPHTEPGMANTFNVKVGFEQRVSDVFAARAGLFFRPTMVPRQDAPGTNILDATRIGGSLGVGSQFHDPLEMFEGPITFDLGLSGSSILNREATKEPTDPVPSYRYSAVVIGAQASLSYAFGGEAPKTRDEAPAVDNEDPAPRTRSRAVEEDEAPRLRSRDTTRVADDVDEVESPRLRSRDTTPTADDADEVSPRPRSRKKSADEEVLSEDEDAPRSRPSKKKKSVDLDEE